MLRSEGELGHDAPALISETNRHCSHNTFWHNSLPSWLPANFTSTELIQTIIPNHVKNVISGMGTNVTSWDVANELIGDTVSRTMVTLPSHIEKTVSLLIQTAFQCIEAKKVWPTTKTDDDPTPFLKDLAFVRAAFSAAHAVAVPGSRLVYNDYSTGQNNSKTECIFKLLADLNANASIPYSRLGVGFQTHISATPGGFASKADLMSTFARLKTLGSGAFITEIDIKLAANTTSDLRYQAAIWGDYLDVSVLRFRHIFLTINSFSGMPV
jgi:endo-1,4-beta-xylanase